jgi:magnesium transporter
MDNTDHEHRNAGNVQHHLLHVQQLLEKQTLIETVTHHEELPRDARHELLDKMLHKRHLAELREKLDELHSADIAYILQALPIDQRLLVWDQVKPNRNGDILIEVSAAVRESLIATMSREELRKAAKQLDTGEIADLAPDLPQTVIRDVFKSLPIEQREQLRAAISYAADSVGAMMDFNIVQVRENVTLGVVSRYLRRFDGLPCHTDQVFVVDRDDRFKGVLPINLIVVNKPKTIVGKVMLNNTIQFNPDGNADQAAQSFERYALVSAPVVDEDGKLVGRLTANEVLDFVRCKFETSLLNQAGLRGEEDIFASVWKSAQNRWTWLALNLCAAFFASRVIGSFENTIVKFVALASLMPIVAGITGNSANQTMTVIIRSLAIGQISQDNARKLMIKELAISGLNGLVWGGIAGLFAYFLYHSVPLGLVMTGAILLNLTVGAIVGMSIPLVMHKMGRDPGIGSGVLSTAITSSSGFFIFLGLAAIFLVPR